MVATTLARAAWRRATRWKTRSHAAAAAAGFLIVAATAQAETPKVDGSISYTAAQAEAGEKTYQANCASCHGQNLEGNIGPALAGPKFAAEARFQGLTADFLLEFMSSQMPQTNPGSLSATQYLDLLAFILQRNGFAAGDTALANDQSKLSKVSLGSHTGAATTSAHQDASDNDAN